MQFPIPDPLRRVLDQTPEIRRAYLVGGSVRDWLLGIAVKDYDVEVYGLGYDALAQALARWGKVNQVGRSFGVVKLTLPDGPTYDFTIPRRDSKVAPGHKGFLVSFDPAISPREAAARRDFTLNALMFDPHAGALLDFFGGEADLRARILRHTSDAFGEDPLRVLRGMQLAARFDLRVAPETATLCKSIRGSYTELAVERIAEEWCKWAEKSVRPSSGLLFLAETGWLEHFPEIAAMQGTPQEPAWHPEGDVFTHTCHCLDALVALPAWKEAAPEARRVYSLAVLAHDFGKSATTTQAVKDGVLRIVSPEHDERGVELADQFLQRIGLSLAVRERVLPLVGNHLAHLQAPSDRAVRRLARRLAPATIEELALVIEADQRGRPPLPAEPPEELEALLARAKALALQDRAPRPILLGRHLLALGMQAGPAFGPILAAAFEAQLEGQFTDLGGSRRWLAASDLLPPDARERLLKQLALEHEPA